MCYEKQAIPDEEAEDNYLTAKLKENEELEEMLKEGVSAVKPNYVDAAFARVESQSTPDSFTKKRNMTPEEVEVTKRSILLKRQTENILSL